MVLLKACHVCQLIRAQKFLSSLAFTSTGGLSRLNKFLSKGTKLQTHCRQNLPRVKTGQNWLDKQNCVKLINQLSKALTCSTSQVTNISCSCEQLESKESMLFTGVDRFVQLWHFECNGYKRWDKNCHNEMFSLILSKTRFLFVC